MERPPRLLPYNEARDVSRKALEEVTDPLGLEIYARVLREARDRDFAPEEGARSFFTDRGKSELAAKAIVNRLMDFKATKADYEGLYGEIFGTPTVTIQRRGAATPAPSQLPVYEDPTETPEYKALKTPAQQNAYLEAKLKELEEEEKRILSSRGGETQRERLGKPIPFDIPPLNVGSIQVSNTPHYEARDSPGDSSSEEEGELPPPHWLGAPPAPPAQQLPVQETSPEERVENVQYGEAIPLVLRKTKGYEHNTPAEFAADYAADDVADQEALETQRKAAYDLGRGSEKWPPYGKSGHYRDAGGRSVQRAAMSAADIEGKRVENLSRLQRMEKTVEAKRAMDALSAARANDEIQAEAQRRAPIVRSTVESARLSQQERKRKEAQQWRREIIKSANEALYGDVIDDAILDEMGEEDELQLAKSIYRELGGGGTPGWLRRPYKRRAPAAAPKQKKEKKKATPKEKKEQKRHTTRSARGKKKDIGSEEVKRFVEEEIAAAEKVSKIGRKKKGKPRVKKAGKKKSGKKARSSGGKKKKVVQKKKKAAPKKGGKGSYKRTKRVIHVRK